MLSEELSAYTGPRVPDAIDISLRRSLLLH